MTIITQQTGQFSGYNLSELRALTLRMLRATDTSRYSPTGDSDDYDWIDDGLNRGQEEFVRETRCLRTYAVAELKSSYRTYRLPWNFIDFMSAYFYKSEYSDGYKELTVTSIETLNDDSSDWRTKSADPTHIYIDRIYGNNWMFGLYPIPDTNGDTITFDSEFGTVVQWVCPNFEYNTEYGVILRMTDTDEYYLNTDSGVVGQVEAMNGNVWLEYYRLPEKLIEVTNETLGIQGVQIPEIPREYHKSLIYFAVADLLSNNPEDSAEFKRSKEYEKRFQLEVNAYIDNRKRPIAGQNLRAAAMVWNWQQNMPFYKGLP